MRHSRAAQSTTGTTIGTARSQPNTAEGARTRSRVNRRKLIGAIVGVLLIGSLAAGCGGADAASGGASNGVSGKLLTSTQHGSGTSTTSTTALANCGSNRDPFDPTGSPPPAGSPAIC